MTPVVNVGSANIDLTIMIMFRTGPYLEIRGPGALIKIHPSFCDRKNKRRCPVIKIKIIYIQL
jgi:hypothetical protein